MTNEEFLYQWYEDVWIKRDFRAGEAAFSAETEGALIAGDLTMQPNDYETLVTALCYNFAPQSLSLSNVISAGSEISAVVTIKGERLDDRQPAQLEIHVYRKIVDGKFVASHSAADHIGYYVAMGQLPEDFMSTLMMGGTISA